MAASIRVILYKHKTHSDGTHPIVIQVIVNRKPIKKTIARCTPEQWNDDTKRLRPKKHPNYALINKQISDELNRIESELLLQGATNVKGIVSNIKEDPESFMLIEMLKKKRDLYFDTLKIGGYKHYGTVVNELLEYLSKDIAVQDITSEWIDRYVSYLANRPVKPNKINTIAKKLESISSVISAAKKRDGNLRNPFDDYRIKKQKVLKTKLTLNELAIFREFKLNTAHQELCRDIFLFQIYFRGMRIGDVLDLKKSSVINDRIKFVDEKTEKNFDIKLIPQARDLIDKYWHSESDRIFPLLKWKDKPELTLAQNTYAKKKAIESCTSMVNNVISKIGETSSIKKKIRTHTARHTFIKIASDTIQNTRITMGLSGHTSLKIHQNYIEDLNQEDELDSAVDRLTF
jgi:integrase